MIISQNKHSIALKL